MFRFLLVTLISLFFPLHSFAVDPHRHDLFERLALNQSFLDSPVCAVRRNGGALAIDFSSSASDPALQTGKVQFLGNSHNEDDDHGNVVAEIISRFLPEGRTFLHAPSSSTSCGIEDLDLDDFLSARSLGFKNESLPLVINYSIGSTANPERIYRAISPILQDKIVVISAGNEGRSIGGDDIKRLDFSKIYARLTPQERKRVIFVGATRQQEGRELLDSRFNVAGQLQEHFILAPTNFSSFSPASQSSRIFSGTSTAAPVVSGLLTRALLANPDLTLEEAVQLLFQTANKRNLVSTGDSTFDASLYGHGVVDAPTFLLAAHALNVHREQGNMSVIPLDRLIEVSEPNIFRDYRGSLQNRLRILSALIDYRGERGIESHIQRIARDGYLNDESIPSSELTLVNFAAFSEIFRAQAFPESRFTSFVLSNFPFDSLNDDGQSLLILAIRHKRDDLVRRLFEEGFDVNFRGNDLDGHPGLLPIRPACFFGNIRYVAELLKRGSLIGDSDCVLSTLMGSMKQPHRIKDILEIFELLYKKGANFCTKFPGFIMIPNSDLAFINMNIYEAAAVVLGQKSPIAKRLMKYFFKSKKKNEKDEKSQKPTKKREEKKEKPNNIKTKKQAKLERKQTKKQTKQLKKEEKNKKKQEKKKAKLEKKANIKQIKLRKKEVKKQAKLEKKEARIQTRLRKKEEKAQKKAHKQERKNK